jgi:hypothetical protein
MAPCALEGAIPRQNRKTQTETLPGLPPLLTQGPSGRMPWPVVLCYRIAGHVKQAAKEVRVFRPRCLFLAGGFLLRGAAREGDCDDQGLEPPDTAGA